MKKSALVALFVTMLLPALAQEVDTLGWDNFNNGTPTLYESPNGGYAFGNNGYGDKAKAQSFEVEEPIDVYAALINFGEVNFGSDDSTSYVAVNLYRNDSLGITVVSNTDSVAPGTLWATDTIMVYQLETLSGLLRVDFSADSLQFNEGEISVGVDLTGMVSGDTLGILSTTDGDAQITQNAWELTAENNWIVVAQPAYSWNLDVDLAIFAVVEKTEPASVSAISGVERLKIFPNPTNGMLFIDSYQSTKPSIGSQVSIYDLSGRNVMNQTVIGSEGVDVRDLPTGVYMLQLQIDGTVQVVRFVKQ